MNTATISLRRAPRRSLLGAAFIGALATLAYYAHAVPGSGLSSPARLGIAVYLFAFFTLLAYQLLARTLLPRLRAMRARQRWAWLLGALATGTFLMLVIPLRPPTPATNHTLVLTPTGGRNPAAQGSEVWVFGINRGDGAWQTGNALTPSRGWEVRESALVATDAGAEPLRWQGLLSEGAQVRLLAHPWSGTVNVSVDGGAAQTIDLYSEADGPIDITLPLDATPLDATARARLALVLAADAVIIALLVLATTLALAGRRSTPAPTPEPQRWSWAWYALPCALVWLYFLLAFWPGYMSNDSINQWQQVMSGNFVDNHPATHTMFLWLLTRLWPSPAVVPLMHIVVLSVVFGLTMHELMRWGVPRAVLATITVLFCLAPINAAMTITLWKDVLYSICLLAVFSLLLRVVRTEGAWLRSWRNSALLTLVLAAVALIRHNGLPLAPMILAVIFLLLPAYRRHSIALGAAWVAVVLIVRLGLYNLVGVEPMKRAYSLYFSVHQVAAMVHNGVELTPADQRLLGEIQPMEQWGRNYYCYGGDPSFWARGFNYTALEQNAAAFTELWLRLARQHPDVMLHHVFCINALNWRIVPASGSYLYAVHNGIDANGVGLAPTPVLPSATQPLRAYFDWFNRSAQGWVWRPGLYLYITLFTVVICALRRRAPLVLLLSTVSLSNILVMLVLTPAQDLRYQYGVVMIGMIAPALLWATSAPRSAASATPPMPLASVAPPPHSVPTTAAR